MEMENTSKGGGKHGLTVTLLYSRPTNLELSKEWNLKTGWKTGEKTNTFRTDSLMSPVSVKMLEGEKAE